MIIWIIALLVLFLAIALLLLSRRVATLDSRREVVHMYENVEWDSQAAKYVQQKVKELKWSLVGWFAALMAVQTIALFLAIIYVLENVGN